MVGRAHPELDPGRAPGLARVEPVQLAPVGRGPHGQHLDPHRRQLQLAREAEREGAGRRLDGAPLFAGERPPQRLDERLELARARQRHGA